MPDGSLQSDLRYADALLQLKSVNAETREFEGIASTPSVDFGGDMMDPLGAKFRLPLTFMWQHGKEDIKDPIGWITHAVATADGIRVKGRFDDGHGAPAALKEQIDRAFYLVKKRLVTGLSIGWRGLEFERVKAGEQTVMRWKKWIWSELSAVRIGMNADATITAVKSINQALRAPSSTAPRSSPVASGTSSTIPRSNSMKGIPEQISSNEDERNKVQTRIAELNSKSNGDPDELEPVEQTELDQLSDDIVALDLKLKRLHTMQGTISKATPIPYAAGTDPDRGSRLRYGDAQMKSSLPPGTMFARAVHAKVLGVKNMMTMRDTAAYAAKQFRDTPDVAAYLMAKADPGTGLSGNWAEPLSVIRTVEGDFIRELRPATIVGRLGLRPAPFNTRMIVQGPAQSNANWVGNAAAKPVGEGVYDAVEIGISKIAEIIVLTQDQILSSAIDSVEATRLDLIARISQFADQQFTDPTVAAGPNNPASVTNGVDPVPSGGATGEDLLHDLYMLINRFNAANIPLTSVTLIMSSFVAWGIAGLRSTLNVPIFPNVSITGGNIEGINVIVSNNVGGDSSGSNIIAVIPSLIMLAQDGGIKVDMSDQATVDMAGGNTPTFSLWQKNAVGLRCEWFVSWKKANPEAAQYIASAAYAPAAP